jgi:hypothetical protein
VTIEEVSPTSWEELRTELERIPSGSAASPIAGHSALFRGCGDSSWPLQTSLRRCAGVTREKEVAVLNDFLHFADSELKNGNIRVDLYWQVLAVAQHYGTPTRLLDWSVNYDTALHFATHQAHEANHEGAVWVVNPNIVHERLLSADLRDRLSGSTRSDPGVILERSLSAHVSDARALDLISSSCGTTPVIFFAPAWTNGRIKEQGGMFSVVGDPTVDLQDILTGIPGCARKVNISIALKDEVRKKLDDWSRDERIFFPGLDGLSSFLTRKHRRA